MTVVFVSDMDIVGKGFNASFKAVSVENKFDDNCGVFFNMTAREGNFTGPLMEGKPGTPLAYPPNTDCQWTIDVGELKAGEVIQVWFEKFDIEDSPNCQYDSLLLFLGCDIDDKRLGAPVVLRSTLVFIRLALL